MTIKNKIKTTIATGLAALAGFMPITANSQENVERAPIRLEQRLIGDSSQDHILSETRLNQKGHRALIEVNGEDYRLGAHMDTEYLDVNLGYQDIGDAKATRTLIELGNKTKIGASFQTSDDKDDFHEIYALGNLKGIDLEAEINSKKHVTALARKNIGEDYTLGLAGTLSTTNSNYSRAGIALGHTGKIGFLAYAIVGENEDGSQHKDFRIRGGLGNKTVKQSIGAFSVNESCFFDEDLITDITDPFYTGNICNYAADIRGDPLGFDIRYINDVASAQVAGRFGRFTLMPGIYENTKTHDTSFNLEAKADLGKGFYLKAQNRASEDKKPEQAVAVGYKHKF